MPNDVLRARLKWKKAEAWLELLKADLARLEQSGEATTPHELDHLRYDVLSAAIDVDLATLDVKEAEGR